MAEEKNNNKIEEQVKDKKKDKNNKKGEEKEEKKEPEGQVPLLKLFSFGDKYDFIMMFIATLACVAVGGAMPIFSLLFGDVINSFTPEKFADPDFQIGKSLQDVSVRFVYLAIAAFVCGYLGTGLWMITGARQIFKIRKAVIQSLVTQHIAYFDLNKASGLTAKLAGDTALMEAGIGEKVGTTFQYLGTLLIGFAVGVSRGWQLTLVILAMTPLLAVVGGIFATLSTKLTTSGQAGYSDAGACAEEALSAIRTVHAFSAVEKESVRYNEKLILALRSGLKKVFANSMGMAVVLFTYLATSSLSFWYGGKLISDRTYNHLTGRDWAAGDVFAVFFAVQAGAMALGQISPYLAAVMTARGAAFSLFKIIELKSEIDPLSETGTKLENVKGDIEFRDIHFAYPSRPEVPIFQGLNLRIKQGQTVALVGDSGGGKSSIIALLQRFYKPLQGSIFVDGMDIADVNLKSLRYSMGVVSQEGILFSGTIASNIRLGKADATEEEIIEAAKAANAHNFINKLPEKYNTLVGERGVQLSGGQKQRISIARAIIKNPSILLLDEATSALDTGSEQIVQAALNEIMKGRTTIVIAHRLGTIRKADCISFIRHGRIIEMGTHEELMALNGAYAGLVNLQNQIKHENAENKVTDIDAVDLNAKPPKQAEDGEEQEGGVQADDTTQSTKVTFGRLSSYVLEYKALLVSGIIGAMLCGVAWPMFGVFFSRMTKIYQNPDISQVVDDIVLWSILYLVLALYTGTSNFFQNYSFGVIGERMVTKLRRQAYSSLLNQEISYFDLDDNNVGALSTKLATQPTYIQGLVTTRTGAMIQTLSALITGFVIAFVAGWKLSFVMVALSPLLAVSSLIEAQFAQGFTRTGTKYAQSGRIITECFSNIRTVASFTLERQIIDNYEESLQEPLSANTKRGHISGIARGFSQFALNVVFAIAFYYGGQLLNENEWGSDPDPVATCAVDDIVCQRAADAAYGLQQLMLVIMGVWMAVSLLGESAAIVPDSTKAKMAVASIFSLIDRIPRIEIFVDRAKEISSQNKQDGGLVEFTDVHFTYLTRPTVPVLRGISFVAKPGAMVALVGESGSGKSTIISLLERFYDPTQGTIQIDGVDIRASTLEGVRKQIALVSQEPILFNDTISANITYGMDNVPLEQIEEAAKLANAHDFITSFPNGYNTILGDKFTQLSGGQKQRVAIARAIIRNPRILLLDEATSALDSESEKLVQKALDTAMKGRTTIVVAHRLSTIMHADLIIAMKEGKIIEQGTHNSLLSMQGYYAHLVEAQAL